MFGSTRPPSIVSSTPRDTSCPDLATRAIASSALALASEPGLSEPLPWIVALLGGSRDEPLLSVRINNFFGDAIEPLCRDHAFAHPSPELAHQIGEHRPLFPLDAVVKPERALEHPRGLATEQALGFRVALVDAAPRGAQKQVRNASRLGTLPERDLGGELVLLRARERAFVQPRRQL